MMRMTRHTSSLSELQRFDRHLKYFKQNYYQNCFMDNLLGRTEYFPVARHCIQLRCSSIKTKESKSIYIKSYGTVRLYRGQNPCYILPRSKIQILLRTVWEETRGAQRPESPPKQSSVKFGFCSEVKYKLNSTRPLGRDTVQGAYNEPLWGELYVTWILAPVQS